MRVGGLGYAMRPAAQTGSRISDLRLGEKALDACKTYKVDGWAPVAEEAKRVGGKPVWELVERWLKAQLGGHFGARRINTPKLIGVEGNPGLA